MSRLTMRLHDGKIGCLSEYTMNDLAKKLADYEDKQEQGLLLELPVPLGTMVFCIDTEYEEMYEADSQYYVINEWRFRIEMLDEWGKWVFATEAEAEEALARMKGE